MLGNYINHLMNAYGKNYVIHHLLLCLSLGYYIYPVLLITIKVLGGAETLVDHIMCLKEGSIWEFWVVLQCNMTVSIHYIFDQ